MFGEINADLVQRLTPHIIKLRREAPTAPLTVYIDSPGGSIESYEHLEGLLFKPDQDGNRCRIITVATSLAASAAARLLVRGDYSMAYPNASVHCHGSRFGWEGKMVVTKEGAESMSESLSAFNEEMANSFSHKMVENVPWLYRFNEPQVNERLRKAARKRQAAAQRSYVSHLTSLILEQVGEVASAVLKSSLEELQLVNMLEGFLKRAPRSTLLRKAQQKGRGERECVLLKLIVDFLQQRMNKEERKNGLNKQTVDELVALYSLRRNYYEKFVADCDNPEPLWMMFCDADALGKAAKIKDEARRKKFLREQGDLHLFHVWQLATTMSGRLVKGENPLSATDAYWLGLVEEVVGSGKACKRLVVESP